MKLMKNVAIGIAATSLVMYFMAAGMTKVFFNGEVSGCEAAYKSVVIPEVNPVCSIDKKGQLLVSLSMYGKRLTLNVRTGQVAE